MSETRRSDFLHVGQIRDDTVLSWILQLVPGRSSRGAAPVAIAACEISRASRPGHRYSSATRENLFEQKHLTTSLRPISFLSAVVHCS